MLCLFWYRCLYSSRSVTCFNSSQVTNLAIPSTSCDKPELAKSMGSRRVSPELCMHVATAAVMTDDMRLQAWASTIADKLDSSLEATEGSASRAKSNTASTAA